HRLVPRCGRDAGVVQRDRLVRDVPRGPVRGHGGAPSARGGNRLRVRRNQRRAGEDYGARCPPGMAPVIALRIGDRRIRPGKVLCVARNYAAHAKESGGEVPREPVFFLKPTTALIESGGTIFLPPESSRVEEECELAVVIGKTGRDVPRDRAIALASRIMPLERGDVLATGTPAGVREIRDGDVLSGTIERVGRVDAKVARKV